jgi:hypothetical protein
MSLLSMINNDFWIFFILIKSLHYILNGIICKFIIYKYVYMHFIYIFKYVYMDVMYVDSLFINVLIYYFINTCTFVKATTYVYPISLLH